VITGQVLEIVNRVITTHLVKKAGYSKKTARTVAVTLIQRFGRSGVFMPCGYRPH
jgi:Mor family transcriptional regulator